jgi:hypothetical protein
MARIATAKNKANQAINHAAIQLFYGTFYTKKLHQQDIKVCHAPLGDCASEQPLAFYPNEILISKVLHKFMFA